MAPAQAPELTPEQAYEQLQVWYQTQQQLAKLKELEAQQRRQMVAFYYPEPRVGTNRLDLGAGYDLKLVFGYDYKVDEAALDAVAKADVRKHKLPMDELIEYKPVLVKKVFDALDEEQRAFVEEAFLEKKERSPQLHIVPATGGAGAEAAFAGGEDKVPPRKSAPRKSAPRKSTTRKR